MTRITIFYNQPFGGWTEVWYSNASVPSFLDANTIEALGQSLSFRTPGTSIYGVRYSSIGGTQLSRFFRTTGPIYTSNTLSTGGPDVTSTACEITVLATGGAKKLMWIRGLNDIDVVRTPGFIDTPSARLITFLKEYIQFAVAAGWGIQSVNAPRTTGLVGNKVVSIAPDVALPLQRAVITLINDPTGVLDVGTTARFSGVVKDQTPGFPRLAKVLVRDGAGKKITIGYNLRNQSAVNPTNQLAYPYGATVQLPNPQLTEFVREAEHKTGRPFGLLAGRQRVDIRRF